MQMLRAAILFVLFFAAFAARAEAVAPVDAAPACLSVETEVISGARGEWLYRIVFRNRCGAHRSFYWCAEHPSAALPEPVACPRAARGGEVPAEPRHVVLHRKEFQWHLPAGTRVRFRDCPTEEFPTFGFTCTKAAATARR